MKQFTIQAHKYTHGKKVLEKGFLGLSKSNHQSLSWLRKVEWMVQTNQINNENWTQIKYK